MVLESPVKFDEPPDGLPSHEFCDGLLSRLLRHDELCLRTGGTKLCWKAMRLLCLRGTFTPPAPGVQLPPPMLDAVPWLILPIGIAPRGSVKCCSGSLR